MAGFIMKQVVGGKLSEVKGGFDKLAGEGGEGGGASGNTEEEEELRKAREEEEDRRKEKHLKAEAEREKMRDGIRNKYNIKKKEDFMPSVSPNTIGAARNKTPEELAMEKNAEDDSLIGQLGLTEHVDKAKAAVTGGLNKLPGEGREGKTEEEEQRLQKVRQEEERRKEKYLKADTQREKMRDNIRNKYNIKKNEDFLPSASSNAIRTAHNNAEKLTTEDDSLISQLGLTEHVDKAKAAVIDVTDIMKGFLPFGK